MNIFKTIMKILLTIPYIFLNVYSCLYLSDDTIEPIRQLLSITDEMRYFRYLFFHSDMSMLIIYGIIFLLGGIAWIVLMNIYRHKKKVFTLLMVSMVPNMILCSYVAFDFIRVFFWNIEFWRYAYWLFILWTIANIALCVYLIVCEIRSLKQQTVKAA